MRIAVAAAALAALAVAAPAPAAAQPNAFQVIRGVITQLDRNAEGVEDYTLTLSTGPMRSEIYVYREGDEWQVASPEGEQMGEMLEGLVVWPSFDDLDDEFPAEEEVSDEDMAALSDILQVSEEELDGRPVNMMFMRMDGLVSEAEEMPDSLRMYVDPSTNQILRVYVAGMAEGMEELGPDAGDMQVTMDFRDYRETDGLTIPRRMRMDLRMDVELTPEQHQMIEAGLQAARAELAQDTSEEARRMAAMLDMFVGLFTEGRVAMDVEVTDVRVNQGPPSWFEG